MSIISLPYKAESINTTSLCINLLDFPSLPNAIGFPFRIKPLANSKPYLVIISSAKDINVIENNQKIIDHLEKVGCTFF